MNTTVFSLLKIGGRSNVEDAIAPAHWKAGMPPVWVVCDGVGGSNFGELASNHAAAVFHRHLSENLAAVPARFTDLLAEAFQLFRTRLEKSIEENPAAANSSTTLTLACMAGGKLYTAWCGDSRIYLLKNGKPTFKSRDHSLVNELIEQGVITEEEAETHPKRNIITRSLNTQTKAADIETKVLVAPAPGDWLLLCTDGLLEQFTEKRFAALLHPYDASRKYEAEIEKICAGKTKDNYSMQLIQFGQASRSGSKSWLILLMLAAVASAAFFFYNRKNNSGPGNAISSDTSSHFLTLPPTDSIRNKDSGSGPGKAADTKPVRLKVPKDSGTAAKRG